MEIRGFLLIKPHKSEEMFDERCFSGSNAALWGIEERVRRMLFTVLNRYDQLAIEEKIADYARKKNIDLAEFEQELAPGISVSTAIGDVVLSLIEQAAAEDKQDFKERQRAGIDRARASGQTIGRPSQKQPKRFQKVCQMYRDKRVTGREAAKLLGVAQSTFYRWLREEELGRKDEPKHE